VGRLALSVALLSAWLALLMLGWSAGGAVYLLLVAALAVFPWRALNARPEGARPEGAQPEVRAPSATTGFESTPTPPTSTSTMSPDASGPTPAGVPVSTTSPGSRVRNRDA